jgi:hypothetical protein
MKMFLFYESKIIIHFEGLIHVLLLAQLLLKVLMEE